LLGGSAYFRTKFISMPILSEKEALVRENEMLKQKLIDVQTNFDLLFNHMNSAFALYEMVFDDQGKPVDYRYLKVNNEFEKITGLKAVDIVGKCVSEVHPETENFWIEVYGEVALTGQPKDIEEFSPQLGRYFGVRAYSPGKGLFATTFIDITKRKLAEIALQDNEELFRSIFEQAASGICIVSVEGSFMKINDRFCNMLGYDEDELLQMTYMDITYPEDMGKDGQLFDDLCSGRSDTYSIEKRYLAKDGECVWVKLYVAAVRNKDNSVKYLIKIINDVTDRKFSEQKLKQSYQQIRKFNFELNKAKAKAEESDRLKSAFLANMSHEIRTPMNGIVGFVNMLKRKEITEEKRNSYIDIIQSSCNQLLHIVNDIVDISKIEAGQVDIKREEENVNDIIVELKEFYKPRSSSKSIELIVNMGEDDENSNFYCDGTKIRQVMNNLLNNALKFTEEGYVEFGYKVTEGLLEFFVKDSGIGISDEHINVIFDRFRQAETSLSRGFGGTGLGLSISKAYVEKMGGELWVKSKLGEGTCFMFTVPVIEESNEHLKDTTSDFMKNYEDKPTVLVTEDEEINYMLIEELLVDFEIELLHARNGQEAIDMCHSYPEIKLVLMDIKMPGMSGYEAAKKIKVFRKELPIIAQTAYALNGDKEKAIESGCDDYIAKPINTDVFVELMQKYM